MRVNVAGAGAGKTSSMAELLTGSTITEGKVVFCIAFTNAAVDNIVEKVTIKLGAVPDNIRISTIHSFLYQELIEPYYYFLYGQHFERLSVIDLPPEPRYRRVRLSQLESDNLLHFTKIPEKAKWVVYQKSGDCKAVKDARQRVLNHFKDYCAAIYVDEAQDIGKDVKHILDSLDGAGVDIILFGDPKQDVRGLGYFKSIIDASNNVQYIPSCHRCPQKHLELSNTLAQDSEKQVADGDNAEGSIDIVFESDVEEITQFLSDGNYGLQYISMKRERFATHEMQKVGDRFETLLYEVKRAVLEKWTGHMPEIEIDRSAFFITEKMMERFDGGVSATAIINGWVNAGAFDRLTKQRYAQMSAAFKTSEDGKVDNPVIPSIESVKGLEAKRCLFILTTDLAPYLFREKTEDNKTSHLLYVALTRSLDNLTILVTKEVEDKYTRTEIEKFFANSGGKC